MRELKLRFNQIVKDQLQSYVYLLVDKRNNEIVYIGKGTGDRIFDHSYESLAENIENTSEKIERIRKLNETNNIGYYIVRHGLSDHEAHILETALIDIFSNPNLKGIHNLTNKINGFKHELGLKTAKEIEEKYTRGTLKPDQIPHKVICININKTYESHRNNIYDAVKGSWNINPERAKKYDYVLAEYNGVIVGIYKAIEWKPDDEAMDNYIKEKTNDNKKYRKRNFSKFIGYEIRDREICDIYYHKKIVKTKNLPDGLSQEFDKKTKGQRNPIRYFDSTSKKTKK